MTNNKTLYVVIIILIVVAIGGGLFFLGNKTSAPEEGQAPVVNEQESTEPAASSPAEEEMVDCGEITDPECFLGRMNQCLPVTAKMTGSDGKTSIKIAILGIENDKCHFQRKLNGVVDLNCLFPKGTMNMDTLDQTFGNDKGLQQVVDDACSPAGW
ncbi:MAG: hypothetical protein PHU56_00635 [Candidatus Pacebacteria bacterium]|nr:hypothetical protein [Candidatus Paceibacterota bacterium]